MALASVFGTSLFHYEPDGVVEFYEAYPQVRESFARAAEWTGLGLEPLLYQNGSYEDASQEIRAVSVGMTAAQLGIQDVLIAEGLRPDMVGGLSLGGLVGGCVAGSIGRKELLRLLTRGQHQPGLDEQDRPEGIASAYLPLDFDPDHYFGPEREGVHLSCDFGCDAGGRIRIIMLSGYRDALEKLAAEQPDGVINITEGADVAVHSPLRERLREQTRAKVVPLTFEDPRLPLCSSLEQKTLTTAGEVRDMFVDNVVRPINLVHLNREFERNGARLGLVIGPSPIMNALRYPFPTVFVDSPAAVSQAVEAASEHGLPLRSA